MKNTITPFSTVYSAFLRLATDDLYMEITELETFELLQELLVSAIPRFEFPRFDIEDYEITYMEDVQTYCGVESDYKEVEASLYSEGHFNSKLTNLEIEILATQMIVGWLSQQAANIDLVRMKYSGEDFGITSQANHIHKVQSLKESYEKESMHLQRLYCRREKGDDGIYQSAFYQLMETRPSGREKQGRPKPLSSSAGSGGYFYGSRY